MVSQVPARYPQSVLTLSVAPCNHPDTTQGRPTERLTRLAVRRIFDTRRRIETRMWAARSVVVAEQLRQMRGSFS